MAQSVARQWPALPGADPEQLRNWAAQITRLLQEGAITAGLGPGDVVGPAGLVGDGNVVLFDGTTGELLKDSGLPIGASGNRWGVIPFVAADGVMEVGRYIDFHNSDADAMDNANRLETNGGTAGLFETPSGGVLKRLVSLINSTLAQGDVIYFDGTNFVRLAPGTAGQFLRTAGAGANPQWAAGGGITTIASGSFAAANSQVIATSIPATFAYLVLVIAGVSSNTATRSVFVQPSFDNGASYDTTAANYIGFREDGGSIGALATASFIFDTATTAALTRTHTIKLCGYQAGPFTMFNSAGAGGASGTPLVTDGWHNNTNAINALRVIWDGTGNFDAGTYALYGIS